MYFVCFLAIDHFLHKGIFKSKNVIIIIIFRRSLTNIVSDQPHPQPLPPHVDQPHPQPQAPQPHPQSGIPQELCRSVRSPSLDLGTVCKSVNIPTRPPVV